MKEIQDCSNEWQRPISRGDSNEKGKIQWRNLKIFSRTSGSILTKIGTKHHWVKKIHVCRKKGPGPFPTGDHNTLMAL